MKNKNEDPVLKRVSRIAIHAWLAKTARDMGLGPRPPEVAKVDAKCLKTDVLYVLKRMKGGDTEVNRRRLHYAINRMIKELDSNPSEFFPDNSELPLL